MQDAVSFIEVGSSDAERSAVFFQRVFKWDFHPMGEGGGLVSNAWPLPRSARDSLRTASTDQMIVVSQGDKRLVRLPHVDGDVLRDLIAPIGVELDALQVTDHFMNQVLVEGIARSCSTNVRRGDVMNTFTPGHAMGYVANMRRSVDGLLTIVTARTSTPLAAETRG